MNFVACTFRALYGDAVRCNRDPSEPTLDRNRIRRVISGVYDAVGREGARPPPGLRLATGAALARDLGYREEDLEAIPGRVLEAFVGAAPLHDRVEGAAGDWVVDLGCGSGLDALLAARRGFRVAALDASIPMLRRLARSVSERASDPTPRSPPPAAVHPIRAELPEIPLRSGSASWALLNGAANLVPDRKRLLGEVHRVLRPGAHLLVADVLALEELPAELRELPEAWAWCLGGATSGDAWERDLAESGFCEVHIDRLEESPPVARGLIQARKAG